MGKGSGKRFPDPRDLPHAFKVLCPDELVGCLMGKGGRVKDDIQEETAARIVVSQRDEYFPGTRLRILTLFHESSDGISEALSRIVDLIVECGDKERSNPNPPKGDSEFIGKDPGTFVCRIAVSPKAAGCIIGTKGSKVKQLREEAQAQVTINVAVQMDHQECKVVAAADGLVRALRGLNDSVQQESAKESRDMFKQWAFTTFPRGEHEGHVSEPPRREPRREREQPVSEPERERSPRRGHAFEGHDFQGEPERDHFENINAGLGIIETACGEFPPGELDEERIITCEMPRDKVGAMIGKHGTFIQEIRKVTRTQIHFDESEAPIEAETQTLVIQGKIIDTYRAHVLMMKRYHECDEAQRRTERPDVSELQRQVEELQKQLEATQNSKEQGKGKGKEKGKGKSKSSKGKGKAKA